MRASFPTALDRATGSKQILTGLRVLLLPKLWHVRPRVGIWRGRECWHEPRTHPQASLSRRGADFLRRLWLTRRGASRTPPARSRLSTSELNRYGTMTLEEIKALQVSKVAADTAHLYLWVPNALLPEGLAVMQAWGFKYKANVVWHKIRKDGGSDGRGVGFYFRNVTELLLFGVIGKNARTLGPGRNSGKYDRDPQAGTLPQAGRAVQPDRSHARPDLTWRCSGVASARAGRHGATKPTSRMSRPGKPTPTTHILGGRSPPSDGSSPCLTSSSTPVSGSPKVTREDGRPISPHYAARWRFWRLFGVFGRFGRTSSAPALSLSFGWRRFAG